MIRHPRFDRDVRTLRRKYPHIADDVDAFARLLDDRPALFQGVRLTGFGSRLVFKARLVSRDLQKGKSGGFRIVLELVQDDYCAILLYSHSGAGVIGSDEQEMVNEIMRRLS